MITCCLSALGINVFLHLGLKQLVSITNSLSLRVWSCHAHISEMKAPFYFTQKA